MSRSISDINAKIAYLTNRKLGHPALKAKDPFVMYNKPPKLRLKETGECKQELTDLLECVAENNDNAQCAQYFTSLLKCNEAEAKEKATTMQKLLKGEKVNGRYHPKVLKKLLNEYSEKRNKNAEIVQRNLLNTLADSRTKPYPHKDTGRPFHKRS